MDPSKTWDVGRLLAAAVSRVSTETSLSLKLLTAVLEAEPRSASDRERVGTLVCWL